MQLQVPGVTRPDFWYRTVVVRVIVIQHTRDVTTPAGDSGQRGHGERPQRFDGQQCRGEHRRSPLFFGELYVLIGPRAPPSLGPRTRIWSYANDASHHQNVLPTRHVPRRARGARGRGALGGARARCRRRGGGGG